MNSELTVMMPIFWRDLDRVADTITSLIKYINPRKIVLIGPASMEEHIPVRDERVQYIDGNTIIPGMSKESIAEAIIKRQREAGIQELANRAGWLLQQFIKYGYSVYSGEEEYLVWDADVVLNREIEFKKDGKPKFILYDHHMHIEYLPTIKLLLGETLHPQGEYTFVNPYMLIKSSIMKEMLDAISDNDKVSGDNWWEKCINAMPVKDLSHSGFSEFETYGEYVISTHPDAYLYETSYKHLLCTKHYFGEEVDKAMIPWIAKDYSTMGFEGYDKPDEYWINKTRKAYEKGKPFHAVVAQNDRRYHLKQRYESLKRKLAGLFR